jgi:hypothetical protein
MIHDFAFWGVFLHPYMIALIMAIALSRPTCVGLNRLGFYRFVWHPGLFDFAIFFLLYGVFLWLLIPDFLSGLFL